MIDGRKLTYDVILKDISFNNHYKEGCKARALKSASYAKEKLKEWEHPSLMLYTGKLASEVADQITEHYPANNMAPFKLLAPRDFYAICFEVVHCIITAQFEAYRSKDSKDKDLPMTAATSLLGRMSKRYGYKVNEFETQAKCFWHVVRALTDLGYIKPEPVLDSSAYRAPTLQRCIELEEKVLNKVDKLLNKEPNLSDFFPHHPSLLPLTPWSSTKGGGNTRFNPNLQLINEESTKRTYTSKLFHKSMDWLDAVNILQDNSYKINTIVLNILKTYGDDYRWLSFPFMADSRKKEASERSKKDHTRRVLVTAERYIGEEKFYLSVYMDFRGRIYTGASLNPQGGDTEKGLLMFADGHALGASGVKWLKRHIANSYGMDKISGEDKEKWVDENMELIMATAFQVDGDPLKEAWLKVDSPVVFLAACIDYIRAVSTGNPESYISHLPIALDATCSGFQHISGIVYDELAGKHVNLSDNPERQDLYGAAAEKVSELIHNDNFFIKKESKKGDTELEVQYKELIKQLSLDRSIVKKTVMIIPYGGTKKGFRNALKDALEDKHKSSIHNTLNIDEELSWKLMSYLGDLVYEAIRQISPKGFELMDILQKIASAKKEHIQWEVHDGFITYMNYVKVTRKEIEFMYMGKKVSYTVLLQDPERTPAVKKARNAIVPNFIHSLDSCLVRQATERLYAEGVTDFSPIHDSFNCHAANAEKMRRVVQEVFIDMYKDNRVIDQINAWAEEVGIPDRLTPGKLNIHDVRKNEYFIS